MPDIRLIRALAAHGRDRHRERTPIDAVSGTEPAAPLVGAAAAGGVSGLLGAWPGGKGVRLVPELAGGPASERRVRWFEIVDAVERQSAGTVARRGGLCPLQQGGYARTASPVWKTKIL